MRRWAPAFVPLWLALCCAGCINSTLPGCSPASGPDVGGERNSDISGGADVLLDARWQEVARKDRRIEPELHPELCCGQDTQEESGCTPDCANKECGPDGCGGTCGSCGESTGPCKTVNCDDEAGLCVVKNKADGSPCDDGEPCSVENSCLDGECNAGQVLDCDDGLACTDDECTEEAQCLHLDTCAPGLACAALDTGQCLPEAGCGSMGAECGSVETAFDLLDCGPCGDESECTDGVCNQPDCTMEWVAQAGGGADVVVWGEKRAYVRTGAGQGLRLRVLDTSDVTSPTWSGELNSTELRSEYGAVYRDGRLYMLGSWCRVTAVSVEDPDHPELLGATSLPCDNGNPYYISTQFEPEPSFDVEGDIAYVLENAEGLQIVDMADPESPKVLGQYEMPGVYQRVVRVANGYAYSEASDSVLYVTAVSDPADAVLCAEIELPIVGPVKEMVVEQERVYILDADENLHVVDVSAPCAPLHETSLSVGGSKPSSLAVEGTVVLITDGHAGLYAIDIEDPANPVVVGPFASPHEYWPGYRGAPVIREDHVLARFGGNLAILDVSQPLSPEVAATVWMGYEYHDMLVRSSVAFAATSTPGLEILDISQPGAPVSLGFHITQKPGVGVALAGTTALLAWSGGTTSDDSGLDVVDVTWPTSPTLLGSVQLSGALWDIELVGTVAYAACALSISEGAVWIVDIVEPTAPMVLGNVATESPAKSVLSDTPYLYVGTIHGLDVLLEPVEEGLLPTLLASALVDNDHGYYPASRQELILHENTLLHLFDGHVHVYDISIPDSPVHLDTWAEFGFDIMGAAGEHMVGQKNQTKVIRLLDISDPEGPVEMAQVGSTLFADAFYAESGYLLVGGIRAMDVFDIRGCW